jgi:regulator of protease activity HflC (stomatin/prohibitin superfamily)
MNTQKAILLAVLGFVGLIVFLIVNPLTIVKAGHRGVVTEFGKVSESILGEGIHWVTPIKENVVEMNVQVQKEEVPAVAASKDLQTVSTVIALNYQLDPESVNKLYRDIGKDYKERIIDPAIQEAVKAITSKYTAEELITKRPLVKEDIRVTLAERLQKDYLIVHDVSIVDFKFSQSFNEAIEAKVTAEQNALAAKNKLEQVKFESEQRVTQAQGEAEAIRIQAEAIQSQGGAAYVELKAIEKWNGSLPTYMMGDATPFITVK